MSQQSLESVLLLLVQLVWPVEEKSTKLEDMKKKHKIERTPKKCLLGEYVSTWYDGGSLEPLYLKNHRKLSCNLRPELVWVSLYVATASMLRKLIW